MDGWLDFCIDDIKLEWIDGTESSLSGECSAEDVVHSPTISKFRIIHSPEENPTSEVLTEFLRFVGCITTEFPTTNAEGVIDLPRDNCSVVTIVLGSASVKVNGGFNLIVRLDTNPLRTRTTDKRNSFSNLIGEVIDSVWSDDRKSGGEIQNSELRMQIRQIRDIFFEENLFGYFQNKRSFSVIDMMEVNGPRIRFVEDRARIDMSEEHPAANSYILSMLNAFEAAFNKLGKINNPSVYVRYAKVNIARKIREMYNRVGGLNCSVNIPDAKELLFELDNIYCEYPSYLATMLLAAEVSKSSLSLYVSSSNYYRAFLDIARDNPDEFSSVVYYEYGRHLERTYHDQESAFIAYQKAVELNPFNYQAIFGLCRCEVQAHGNFGAAIKQFQNLREKMLMWFAGGVYESSVGMSLKELQYLYRIDLWLRVLYRKQAEKNADTAAMMRELGESAVQDQKNRRLVVSEKDSLTALKRACGSAVNYQKNRCVMAAYDENDSYAKRLQLYHKNSVPVRAMFRQVKLSTYLEKITKKGGRNEQYY